MASIEQAKDAAAESSSATASASLVFVNVSNPAAVDSTSIRRLVRSSATRHSHRDPTRKPKMRKANRKRDASTANTPASSQAEQDTGSRGNSPSLSDNESRKGSEHLSIGLFKLEDRKRVLEVITTSTQDSNTTTIRLLLKHTSQVNNSYPVDVQEWFPWVLSHYRTTYLPLGIALLQDTNVDGEWFVDWFLREGSLEPALFYMQLLCACSALVHEEKIPEDRLLWLRGMVVRTINEAISDAARALTTGTFLAVALIALHEKLYGDKSLATEVHGRAFARMIEMAGGLDHLVIPKIAWKMLLWIDTLLLSVGGVLDPLTMRLLEVWVPGKLHRLDPG